MPSGLLRDISLRLQSTFSVATKCKAIDFSLLINQNKTIQLFKKKILKEKKKTKTNPICSTRPPLFFVAQSSAALPT